ncbi:hypothetical protein KGF54_003762 [Candida jiufengensis]|uniref:uncharacterized protein n=1 Tax=Candida jiufengensis TaxID=497108 RepID=UPI002224C487|nr:uncharacterized protein KGF54_003762 [Candida jiufengensis]KAI5952895.1 hypothetical protein KGF54_003762 [Candida jiufengensis]
MSLICSISGEITKNPIVSPKSGALFEKKYIEKYVQTTGSDPINNKPLTIEELIPLNLTQNTSQVSSVPPSVSITSIPNLLSTLQNEYDSMVLEIFTLRKNLQSLKLELSSSLYKVDAAVNVASRALRERNEAREALEKLISSIEKNNERLDNEEEKVKQSDEKVENVKDSNGKDEPKQVVIEDIESAREKLFQLHKSQKAKFPYNKSSSFQLEKTDDHKQIFKDNKKLSITYNYSTKQLIAFNSKKVFTQDIETNELKEWDPQLSNISHATINNNGILLAATKLKLKFSNNDTITVKSHIQSVVCHPSLNLFVLIDKNHINLTNTKQILKTYDYINVKKSDIHVDGELFAAYDEKEIKIISLVNGEELTQFQPTYKNVIELKFALNGYWFLILSNNNNKSSLQIIDLRKNEEFSKIEVDDIIGDISIDLTSNIIILKQDTSYLYSIYDKKLKKWSDPKELLEIENDEQLYNYSTYDDLIKDGYLKVVSFNLNDLAIYKLIDKI